MRFIAVPVISLVALVGCQAGEIDEGSSGPDGGVSSGENSDIQATTILDRGKEWVDAKLHYCQSPNHERDYDSACSEYCERDDNKSWDPYRSDCSGFVSWSWGLPAPGRTTLGFAPFEKDITHVIDAVDLEPGDAINNADHVMLFKAWVTKGKRAEFYEEPGCSSATPYAHEVTTDVSVNGTSIYVPYNGMTFSAIRFDGLTHAKPAVDSDRIGVASWGPQRLDLFARNHDNHLIHRYFHDHEWSKWQDLGGDLASAPAAVSWAEGRIDVFARGKNDHLIHDWFDGTWHRGEDLGGQLTSSPTVVSQGVRSLDVFVRGAGNHLEHKYFRDGTGWSGWQNVGGTLDGAPTAASWAPGRIDVFARGGDNVITHVHWISGTGWSTWGTMEAPITQGPAVASWAEGRLDLFGTGANNQLRHRWYTEAKGWSDWEEKGGDLAGAPTAVSWGQGRIDIFARNGGDEQDHKYYNGSWSSWEAQGKLP
jgi:hypothetical protein|nr:hypothetical protein [Kofleriaceae bacterium]